MINICDETDDTRECDCENEEPVGVHRTFYQEKSLKYLRCIEKEDMHEQKSKEDGKMLPCFCRCQRTRKPTKPHEYSDDERKRGCI